MRHARQQHVERRGAGAAISLAAIGRQRIDMAGVDGAGQRDIEDAEALVLQFAHRLRGRGIVGTQLADTGRGIAQHHEAFLAPLTMRPHQGQEHDGELQPLARVERHQLHARGLRFDA